jgi:tRNA (cytidine/uridine-2'-O-)-methyltransferase
MGLAIALIEPDIPPNTGNIARLCAATDSTLHLVGRVGFDLDDPRLSRAGLDYWDAVDMWVHPTWRGFRDTVARERCLYFTSHATRLYLEAPFRPNSVLVFGNETHGMPERIREKHPELLFRIPMGPAVRSLNLATAVGIVLYEAIRHLGLQIDAPLTDDAQHGSDS